MAVDSNGNAYRIYTDFTTIFGEIVIVKYSPEGVRLQEARPASSNPGASIIANGLALDAGRGILYATMDFTDTDFETAGLVVQFDLNLAEGPRDVYRRRDNFSTIGVVGAIHVSPTGKVSVPIREQGNFEFVPFRWLFLRYDPGLLNRVEELLPSAGILSTTQSQSLGDMYGIISPAIPTFPPSPPTYMRVAPTFGTQRPAPPGRLIGVGPEAETYGGLGSRQVQKFDASGVAAWTTPIVTDAGKDDADFARVSNSALYLAGSFIVSGRRRVYLDRYGRATDTLSVALEPSSVKPGAKTQVRVSLKNSQGIPIADRDVTFIAEPVVNSGGHDHSGGRPVGTFSGSSIQLSTAPHGRTGPDGKLTATYTASAFGGQETIKVHLTDTPNVSTSAVLEVRVPGLMPLPAAATYTKDGGTCQHHGPDAPPGCVSPDQNHFGTAATNTAIAAIAAEWLAFAGATRMLEINDMSLQLGGGFDVGGNWTADIVDQFPADRKRCNSTGHCEHRDGTAADFQVSTNLSPGALTQKQQQKLRDIILSRGGSRIHVEGSHWHVRF
ncbi:MAG: hypothetical protein HYV14_08020 [Elusimicrobia bacterium]|nr:hypothetical protein [Elusimicrobiota bacterium]